MPVRYNGSELIPAPLVSWDKQYIKGPDGKILSADYSFTLTGTIVNVDTNKDSPAASGFTGMEGVLAEQQRINNIFSYQGGRLEIEAPGGGGPNTIDLYCTLNSVAFENGIWVSLNKYSVSLLASVMEDSPDVPNGLASFDESWTVNENADGTFSLSHQIQAVGKLYYTEDGQNDPFLAAKDWVQNRQYLNPNGVLTIPTTSGVNFGDFVSRLSSPTNNYWNKAISESADSKTYSYSITESFLHNPSGNYREDWNVAVNYASEDPNKVNIAVNGTVFGFAERDSFRNDKLANAKHAYESYVKDYLYTRLSNFSPAGYTIAPWPISRQETYDQPGGSVSYGYSYFGSTGTLIPNSVDENINVSDTNSKDIFAQIQIPGKSTGPLFQNMYTVTAPERNVSIQATIIPSGFIGGVGGLLAAYLLKPNTDSIINALKPNTGYFYVNSDTEDWNPIKKQYSRSVSWAIDNRGTEYQGKPNIIHNTE